MSSSSYRWIFADEDAHRRLGDHPEESLPGGGISVKRSDIREVLACGEFFWKHDFRGGRHMIGEWKSAMLLRSTHVPCVEYLALGRSLADGNVIITAALPDTCSAGEYWYGNIVSGTENPEEFLRGLTHFVREMLESDLFHPDFHFGNILYDTVRRRFALVDVAGVRQKNWCDSLLPSRRYRMERLILECRRILADREMCEWIARCGIGDAENFLHRGLIREARMLEAQWAKRERQIRDSYWKFVQSDENDRKFARTPQHTIRQSDPRRDLILEGESAWLETLFLAHFYLELALIEHRNVIMWDTQANQILLEPDRPGRANLPDTLQRFAVLKDVAKTRHPATFWHAAEKLLELSLQPSKE